MNKWSRLLRDRVIDRVLKRSSQIPPHECVRCHANLVTAAAVKADESETVPGPGDFALCVICGMVHVFDIGLILRAPNETEIQKFAEENPELLRAAVAATIRWAGIEVTIIEVRERKPS